jgi:hypothetical protein
MLTVAVLNAYADVLNRTDRKKLAIEMAKKAKEKRLSVTQ